MWGAFWLCPPPSAVARGGQLPSPSPEGGGGGGAKSHSKKNVTDFVEKIEKCENRIICVVLLIYSEVWHPSQEIVLRKS